MNDLQLDLNLTTAERVLHLMTVGDIWIERDSHLGFYIAIERLSGSPVPINQALAKSITRDPRVTREEWREGWQFAKHTGKVRWVIGDL
jgi:hypothetical protein